MQICVVSWVEMAPLREELIELLQDAVDSGASVGFLPPISREDAAEYWHSVEKELRARSLVLLAVKDEEGIIGSVQLELTKKPNARHRAEVKKLLVHRRARRKGLGRALMKAVEAQSVALGRTLIVLDTRKGDAAEQLYLSMGYTRVGEIPHYARSANGDLTSTVFFYRELSGD